MKTPTHLLMVIFTIIGLYILEFKEDYIQVIGGIILLIIFVFVGYFDLSKEEIEEVEVENAEI
jgi:multisubunit Na+/H+ antiporter MnhC subunit